MTTWRLLALYISVVCGFVFVSAAVTSDGWDLRPSGGDVSTILEDRTRSAQARQTKVAGLESEIEKLGAKSNSGTLNAENKRIKKYRAAAGMTELVGPGIRVALDDAHQQDIQAVVNALWQGGAEAITLQGQRINSTTGIKCVGNTVVLNGVPYSPPYVIEAVGSQYGMSTALENSPEVSIFRDYATRYGLGYSSDVKREIVIPAYEGVIAMSHANVIE